MRPSTRVVLGFSLFKLALQAVALAPYGYFRDELYYLACANHLAFGYVDHPPFSIALLAAWRSVFGQSLVAIRLVPALAGAALVYLTGRIVLALGGGWIAASLACLAVLSAPSFVGSHHCYSMNALDHLLWAASALCLVRALDQPTRARWALLGVLLGVGLLDKASVLWLGAGVAVTLVATSQGRAALRTGAPFIAGALAALVFLPHVIWQYRHGFPTAEFAANAMAHKYVRLSIFAFFRESTMAMNPFTLPLVLAGVILPFVGRARERTRPLAIVFVVTAVIVVSAKAGKPEYLAAAYPLAFASGAVAVEPFVRGVVPRIATSVVAAGMVALLAVALPFALPILGEESFIAYSRRLGIAPHSSEKKELAALPQFYADMHGWDELVNGAELAWRTLGDDERAHARIWAVSGGYGPAAAIDVLGAARGLPHAIATHNNYWLWGYGDDTDGPVILLGGPRDRLERLFESLIQVTTIECGYCMPYENHKPIYVGRGIKRSWASLWPELKHFE